LQQYNKNEDDLERDRNDEEEERGKKAPRRGNLSNHFKLWAISE
jgi:hypothetical protein